jgi:class 3 adenylate cyclase/tetratricopeptide (TPR) repeat protein
VKCLKCHFENREEVKFCEECGAKLRLMCPHCACEVPMGRRFCGQCGHPLSHASWVVEEITPTIIGERKQITVLFSDLSGYTSMTEKLDPEEVKEIMGRIFAEIIRIVKRYDGFIGRFLGDAAMVLFGVPGSHEDDAVRAIRTAREIHSVVSAMSSDYAGKVGRPLAMHSGINSGLVIISELHSDKAAGEITGDTVNIASRLCSLARVGTILVGPDTQLLAQGYFTFKQCELVEVKGKTEPVEAYEVLTPEMKPRRMRLHGLQAKLVGRASEMAVLAGTVERMQQGRRSIVSICGHPGTGKTRLVEEFRATLDRQQFLWLAANAYGYAQAIPYWPLIDLLNRLWKIEEEDSPECVREKVKAGVEALLGRTEHVSSIIGSLYSLSSPEFEQISPESWKTQLYEAVVSLLGAFAGTRPTVICLEDIHWADPPFVELVRFILSESSFPALLLCVYRPPFKLFTKEPTAAVAECYQEVVLQDLSPAEAQDMMESLLKTQTIPVELKSFVHEKIEGNPFYLEEVINSLTESDILVQDQGVWKLTKPLGESGLSPTIQGVIGARLDRLDVETKRVLQEASVIGRNFLHVILEHITDLRGNLQESLSGLERLDLIRTKSIHPELEYLFKHALTQEVVYNGLLKKERQTVHERIGRVMEELFADRLPEMYETLAFHYKQGNSLHKALDYLVRSGEKSLRRYAVDESHQYFKEGFELLTQNGPKNNADKLTLVDLLIKWASVHYYSGEYRKQQELLEAHRNLAETVADKRRLGMYYAWLSCALWHREMVRDAYDYLTRALRLGEEAGAPMVVGYACAWLTWTCMELGRLDEAIAAGERAQALCRSGDVDQYVFFASLAGLAYAHSQRGEKNKTFEAGKTLVEFGQRHSNIRSMVMGHVFIGMSHAVSGDVSAATACFEEAIRVSADPWYSQFPVMSMCYVCIADGEYQGLQEKLERIQSFSEEHGVEYLGTPAKVLLGAVLVAQGQLGRGMKILEYGAETWLRTGSRLRYAYALLIMGRIYALMAQGGGQIKITTLLRNTGFLIKHAPFAGRKAEKYLSEAIAIAHEIGAKDTVGRARFALGLLHKAKGRRLQARECLTDAIRVFQECGADKYLRKAEEALASTPLGCS